uniref:Nucleolar protein 12 n=1 Tax=Pseudo-nitzschia delicatissima TaxID=44447 RepID=A0A7S0T959_9STRA|mmetsp:Transcript_1416/g.3256  ORF Transcript_1416/g.3256 Transcript_1416/m.3256 type:complete len:262 (+) Transcript_1416:232-1017(+)|eukprot:CAMPEP_0116086630 /NCGR_PEP_ID=MMETSP0327-20121206/4954_1 /TAXON_ID=44447 /ORGANISM="Pseudo-nitzschia delicatissima, Strain B596" /LENGTH=261 /DNA_ID=CAMNT_0003577687 /DNA_START=170 /DNA_END=955 /DNA_ORIENTATION=-
MPKPKRGNKRNNDNHKKKEKSKHKMPASMIKRGNKREVVFDAEARRDHLRGFSARKRERRAFGLAMQKVKDRNAKIEMRASEKKGKLERIEEAEKQKEQFMEDNARMNGDLESGDDDDEASEGESKQEKPKDIIDTKVYDDQKTETAWGGQVVVTTSVVALDDDSEDEELEAYNARRQKSVDTAQKQAGNVQKFMDELKGNMPGKKNSGHRAKRKGKDGASDMKGVGGSGNLKIASKLLNRSKDRSVGGAKGGKKGKKRKR